MQGFERRDQAARRRNLEAKWKSIPLNFPSHMQVPYNGGEMLVSLVESLKLAKKSNRYGIAAKSWGNLALAESQYRIPNAMTSEISVQKSELSMML